MNKLGIWAIAIATAFVIGVLSANPVVEAVGGWQLAFVGLDTRITALETDSSVYELSQIIKIDSGNRFSAPYSLICFEGDWLKSPAGFVADPLVLIRDTVQTAILEGASKSKIIGLQGSAELQDMHAFDVEVTVTILCLSPSS